MGQVAAVVTKKDVAGRMRITQGVINMSTSYATNGDTISPGDVGLTELKTLVIPAVVGARLFEHDPINAKIKAYTAINTQVTATTDLHTVALPFVAFGK